MSDLLNVIDNHDNDGVITSIMIFAMNHLPCLKSGYAFLADKDGIWCSIHEKEQFEIGVEEQND